MYFIEYDGQPRKRYKLSVGNPGKEWYPWGNYTTYDGAVAAFLDHNKYFGYTIGIAKIRDRLDNSTSYIG